MRLLYCFPREMDAMAPEAERLGAQLRNAKYAQIEPGVTHVYATPDAGAIRALCQERDIPCMVVGGAEDAPEPEPVPSDSRYADMGYQELRRLASARDLDVPGRPKKDTLIEALEAADEG